MNAVWYFALAVAAAFSALYIKQIRPDFALAVTLGAVAVLLSAVVPSIAFIISVIRSELSTIDTKFIISVFIIIGTTYLAEFSSDLCIDAGEKALASHIESLGKITVALIAMPIVKDVFTLIINLLE